MKLHTLVVGLVGMVLAAGKVFAAPGQVLILNGTVTGGAASSEAVAAVAAGKTVVLASDAQWSAMTATDFASYDAIVLGDATCVETLTGVQAAINNTAVWGPVLSGNVIIIGTDPVYHSPAQPGAKKLITQGMAFAVGAAGKTGGYLDLSCYYHPAALGTPVPLLDGVSGGGFHVVGGANLPGLNNVHIVATHPALAGLTDADLSNWGNSVHEAFTTWPVQFDVLAIARNTPGSFTATDGTVGYPYILARGAALVVISDIHLTPDNATNVVGATHTVVATVTQNGVPTVGTTVTFKVISGPQLGDTGTAVTDVNGQASFSYVGLAAGEDFIQASFVDSTGATQSSNKATKYWVLCSNPVLTSTAVANRGYYQLSVTSGCYGAAQLQVYVKDSTSAFVAGPYPAGTVVKVKKSAITGTGPASGPASVTIFVTGDGQASATDPDGRASAVVACRSL
jgi:hypothetical protein